MTKRRKQLAIWFGKSLVGNAITVALVGPSPSLPPLSLLNPTNRETMGRHPYGSTLPEYDVNSHQTPPSPSPQYFNRFHRRFRSDRYALHRFAYTVVALTVWIPEDRICNFPVPNWSTRAEV